MHTATTSSIAQPGEVSIISVIPLLKQYDNFGKMGIVEVVSLSVLSVSELLVFVVNTLSSVPEHAKFGFKNTTGQVSDEYYTQVCST